ncbi:uncharacterized protein LOC115416564 [Sphaeramia orbicularis]|uniref:uncharacterized protein LOC115416564 n=1 Tax=Sphaeramia orbicularis TaxID=375764 RepID=UPI001180B924|nr:uncharacterized protein LOC115416564 [Sphaeramia orbicularis]XP_029986238.1 uncharacterized protein LOC115416564 [Sphaeramia orbicularis]
MRRSRVLPPLLSVLLVGVRLSLQDPSQVPVSQLRTLSLGLAHLLQGVDENARRLERQGQRAAMELEGVATGLENLRKQNVQRGRTHRQVRKELQVHVAQGDWLWRTVRDLQRLLQDLETEQDAMQTRLDRILQEVTSLTQNGSTGRIDHGAVKLIMDKQARRLASLTSEVSARDRLINRRRQLIEHLEKQVCDVHPVVFRSDASN